ncbi:MAG: hypothetical protein AB1465_06340 [Patescibacteria group bacterium]
MSAEQHHQESRTQEEPFGRKRPQREKGWQGRRREEKREGLKIEISGSETLEKLFETLSKSIREIIEIGKVMKDMVKELPAEQRNELEERIAGLEQEILRQGEELVEADRKRTALLTENKAFREENERLREEIAQLKSKTPKKALEAEAKAPEAVEPEAEIEKLKEEQKPVEIVIEPEVVEQIREEILREIQENNEKRRELLKEKRVLGQEFAKLYEEISRFVQTDPMAMVLYSKWFKRLMKGKEKEGEEFYQQGEALPQMQEFNSREAELKKRWEEIHQELDDLNSRNRNLRDALARIFSENLEHIKIETKPSEIKPPEAEKPSAEEKEELLREQLGHFETQQNLANLYLEGVQELPTPQIPVSEIRPSQGITIETPEAGIIPSDEEVAPPPLPLKTRQEMAEQKREKEGEVRKLFEDLKSRDPEKIVSAFDILYQKINGNPDYQEILISQLSSELETFDPKKFEGEAYLQNLIIIAGETKDKSFWPKLFAYLPREDISQTSKFFITQSLYKLNKDRFLTEAEDIYEKGGRGAAEAILEITEDDKKLKSKGQKEGWLPPALPRVRSKKRDEEGIRWSGRSKEDVEREDEERRLKEEGIEFPKKAA